MHRLVLDTNVLVSGLITPHGNSARIVEAILAGEWLLIYDQRILDEYQEVLGRSGFGLNPVFIEEILSALESGGELAPALPVAESCPDPDDRMFMEVALGGSADALITGNKKHFPGRSFPFRILSPQEFLALRHS